jgi:glyoxylase-like metal-dependent hydrolase (beta-lactamase superfamily II)
MVEAALHEDRQLAVLAALRARWPQRRVERVVNTHFHFDHAGGIRTWVAEGAEVVTSALNARFFEDVIDRHHFLVPDRLERARRRVGRARVHEIESDEWLDVGGRKILIFTVPSVHASDMLGVYVPDAKVVFESDLYLTASLEPAPTQKGTGLAATESGELIDALSARGLDVTTVVSSHGVTVPIGYVETVAGKTIARAP